VLGEHTPKIKIKTLKMQNNATVTSKLSQIRETLHRLVDKSHQKNHLKSNNPKFENHHHHHHHNNNNNYANKNYTIQNIIDLAIDLRETTM
jgi:hypothetical protein